MLTAGEVKKLKGLTEGERSEVKGDRLKRQTEVNRGSGETGNG
jgi:hypothetical protein